MFRKVTKMEETEVAPLTNIDLRFRIYKTDDDELKKLAQPINPYPDEAINKIKEIVKNATENSPDKPDSEIKLAPVKRDADLKRIMKPQIDELKDETVAALKQIRLHQK